jgi:uncharacterized membrane protein SpoIIM required for sporulation
MVIILMSPVAIVSFLVTQMLLAGIDPVTAFATVIPHGIFEVPAALISGALALRLGASVISPPPGKTVGQGWLEALANAIRVWVMLVLPLIFIAAVVEVTLTPRIVGWIVGGG